MPREVPVSFGCAAERLYGILHLPDAPAPRGVLIVVGGPQYRVGSHRQFVLLARALAAAGTPVLRFDYRGMGDSEGETRGFEGIGPDIRAAVDYFCTAVPTLTEVVIWGLCDAASAALFYAPADPRVAGLVLVNPWVRTEAGIATAYLKRYYLGRLFDPSLWRKIARGEFQYRAAAASLLGNVAASLGFRGAATREAAPAGGNGPLRSLPERMCESWRRYRGRVLVILSGSDLTAQEFKDLVGASRPWRRLLRAPTVVRRDLPGADHTFSRADWRDRVADWTVSWLHSW